MPVKETTKRIIWAKAAGKCSMCKKNLVMGDKSEGSTHLIGEVAHIVAENPNGPRGESPLSLEQRNAENNLLLLCPDCHTLIDLNPDAYPVERLLAIKAKHEEWVLSALSPQPVWDTKLHQMYYINVPRLSLLCATHGYALDLSRYGKIEALHELGWELAGLMGGFNKLLEAVELKAIPIEQAIDYPDKIAGSYISFDGNFRTKNINFPNSPSEYKTEFSGNLQKDPHIYMKTGGYKIVAYIDTRWVTTGTAFCEFKPSAGQNHFAGLAFVNDVDDERKIIRVTPYVVGMPTTDLMEELYYGL